MCGNPPVPIYPFSAVKLPLALQETQTVSRNSSQGISIRTLPPPTTFAKLEP